MRHLTHRALAKEQDVKSAATGNCNGSRNRKRNEKKSKQQWCGHRLWRLHFWLAERSVTPFEKDITRRALWRLAAAANSGQPDLASSRSYRHLHSRTDWSPK